MSRVIAVSSQKGGIGKTTMAANLAVAWSEMGRHVLVVDLDPQFALTRRFGTSPASAPATAFELLAGDGTLFDALVAAGPRLDLLAGHRDLAKLELSLAGEHHREEFVNDLLRTEAVGYDVVIIDCPPNLGLLTVNAIVAANEVLVPVNMTDEGALQGAAEVRSIVGQLARRCDVRVRALVRQMVDRRRIVYQQMNAGLPELGLPIARTEIPLTAAFQNAAAERLPLLKWRAHAPGAEAYRDPGRGAPPAPPDPHPGMSGARRKLAAIDDPLFSAPATRSPAREKRTADLYVELPVEQWDALARAAVELRTHKRRIIAALIARYVDATTDEGQRRVAELLEEHGRLDP